MGFEQPHEPHQHWHVNVSYLNISSTFRYLCGLVDGYSRLLVHWDLREAMREADIEIILERAEERYPEGKRGSFPTTDRSASPGTSRS